MNVCVCVCARVRACVRACVCVCVQTVTPKCNYTTVKVWYIFALGHIYISFPTRVGGPSPPTPPPPLPPNPHLAQTMAGSDCVLLFH